MESTHFNIAPNGIVWEVHTDADLSIEPPNVLNFVVNFNTTTVEFEDGKAVHAPKEDCE